MLPDNETRAFLGIEYAWSNVSWRLEDVQALHGGVRVWVPHWGAAFVTQVAPGGREAKFKVPVSSKERKQFVRLCIEQDFVTIQPEERPGVPDEARPSITLSNYKREEHTISKWAGVQDARFEVIYQALLDIADRTEGRKPIPKRFKPWQKTVFWIGIAFLILLPILLGFGLARTAVTAWWPEKLGTLVGTLLLLVICIPLLLLVLRWLERRKATYDRVFINTWLLIIFSLLYFTVLLAIPGFLRRVSLVVWGNTVVGTIQTLDHSTFIDDTGPTDTFSVRYAFQTEDGRDYERQVTVDRTTFETLAEGDSITVNYLPFLPRYSLLGYHVTSEAVDYAFILFTAVLAMYLFMGEAALLGPTFYRIQDERW
jgi:hypothetical protein